MSDFRVFRVYREDGGRIAGRFERAAVDDLSAGDVVIKIAYSSVNYKDALAATGRAKIMRRFPLIAGIDAAGYVTASTDQRFKEGDAVVVTGFEFGTDHDGGYGEYARVPAEWVVPLPGNLSPERAMAIGTAGFTVALCIHRLEENRQCPERGPFVVTGASGGVGHFAIDLLSRLGYEVCAVSRKAGEHDNLRALGASQIIDARAIDCATPPLGKAQWGGAIDTVGGDLLAWLISTTRPWGNVVAVGMAGGSHLQATVMPFILRGVSLIGVTSSGCPAAIRPQLWQRLADDLAPAHLDRIVTRTATLDDLPEIFDGLLAGASTGRTVIRIAGE